MKKILILGAGLSTISLIDYLLNYSEENDWEIIVGDLNPENTLKKLKGNKRGKYIYFDVNNHNDVDLIIEGADLVISMLPAYFHTIIAKSCLLNKKHMITASYVSPEMKALDQDAKEAGILILNELGVDPGIDHMSAMQIIHNIQEKGGVLKGFWSATGGLIAPDSDNNPWNYKFTWNPRNVVLAGQGTSQYIKNGMYKYIPYHRLFSRLIKTSIQGYGDFEIYPNRDSLKYRQIYELSDIPTLFRGTMRRPGFCEAWNVFVQLGITDDTYTIENSENMTFREFINSFLKYEENIPVEFKLARYIGIEDDSLVMEKLKWLGIFENQKIGLKNATPAQILQMILEKKLKLEQNDKDMIVMQHIFEYELNGVKKGIKSSLVVLGKDQIHTAMAMTVGTPVAIATKLLLTGKLNYTGVQIPVKKDIYEPILKELETYGIKFIEEEYNILN